MGAGLDGGESPPYAEGHPPWEQQARPATPPPYGGRGNFGGHGVYIERQEPWQHMVRQPPLAHHIAALLKHGSPLRGYVKECFRQASVGQLALGERCLGEFTCALSRALGIPQNVFGNLHDDFIRFDFDGDGSIEEHEAYKLVKACLREHLKRLEPWLFQPSVRFSNPHDAGFTVEKELGRGGMGVAMLAVDHAGEFRCIKYNPKCNMDRHMLEEILEEFVVMRELEGTRIARTFDIFQDSEYVYFVNEAYFGGDLTGITRRALMDGVEPCEAYWREIFLQCFNGLLHMHNNCMMHCDIKEPNIMLKADDYECPQVVIIDYGLARAFAADEQTICGTPGYIPPETWKKQKWYPKGDCFSMGVTMLQLVTDNVPSPNGSAGIFATGARSVQEVGHITCSRPAPLQLLPYESTSLLGLLEGLLAKDQRHRLNAVQALRQPWFADPGNPRAVHHMYGDFWEARQPKPPPSPAPLVRVRRRPPQHFVHRLTTREVPVLGASRTLAQPVRSRTPPARAEIWARSPSPARDLTPPPRRASTWSATPLAQRAALGTLDEKATHYRRLDPSRVARESW